MPYAPGEASRSVTATAYTITLEKLPAYVVAGGDVYFEGTLTVDGKPAPRETVKIKRCPYESPQTCVDVVTLTTGAMGEFYTIWKPTHDLACRRHYFYAEHPASGAKSAAQLVAIAYPVRVSVTAPDTVVVNQPFDVRGKLEYESSPGTWVGLANRKVYVYVDDTKVAEATTASDGSYSVRITINRSGTHTIRVVFPGEGLPTAQATAVAAGTEVFLPSLLVASSALVAVLAPLFASLF